MATRAIGRQFHRAKLSNDIKTDPNNIGPFSNLCCCRHQRDTDYNSSDDVNNSSVSSSSKKEGYSNYDNNNLYSPLTTYNSDVLTATLPTRASTSRSVVSAPGTSNLAVLNPKKKRSIDVEGVRRRSSRASGGSYGRRSQSLSSVRWRTSAPCLSIAVDADHKKSDTAQEHNSGNPSARPFSGYQATTSLNPYFSESSQCPAVECDTANLCDAPCSVNSVVRTGLSTFSGGFLCTQCSTTSNGTGRCYCAASGDIHKGNTGNIKSHESSPTPQPAVPHHLQLHNNYGTHSAAAVGSLESCRGEFGGGPCRSLMLLNKKKSIISKVWRKRIKQPKSPTKSPSQCPLPMSETSTTPTTLPFYHVTSQFSRVAQPHLSQSHFLTSHASTSVFPCYSTEGHTSSPLLINGTDPALKASVEHVLNQLKFEQIKDLQQALESRSSTGPCVLVPREDVTVGGPSRGTLYSVSPIYLSLVVWRWPGLKRDVLLKSLPSCSRDPYSHCINPYHTAVSCLRHTGN